LMLMSYDCSRTNRRLRPALLRTEAETDMVIVHHVASNHRCPGLCRRSEFLPMRAAPYMNRDPSSLGVPRSDGHVGHAEHTAACRVSQCAAAELGASMIRAERVPREFSLAHPSVQLPHQSKRS
jgi:hypothetical protein